MTEEIIFKGLQEAKAMLVVLVECQQVREWYSVEEFARTVGKAKFTIRECWRPGRRHADKRMSGRGAYPAWVNYSYGIDGYQSDGMLPIVAREKSCWELPRRRPVTEKITQQE